MCESTIVRRQYPFARPIERFEISPVNVLTQCVTED